MKYLSWISSKCWATAPLERGSWWCFRPPLSSICLVISDLFMNHPHSPSLRKIGSISSQNLTQSWQWLRWLVLAISFTLQNKMWHVNKVWWHGCAKFHLTAHCRQAELDCQIYQITFIDLSCLPPDFLNRKWYNRYCYGFPMHCKRKVFQIRSRASWFVWLSLQVYVVCTPDVCTHSQSPRALCFSWIHSEYSKHIQSVGSCCQWVTKRARLLYLCTFHPRMNCFCCVVSNSRYKEICQSTGCLLCLQLPFGSDFSTWDDKMYLFLSSWHRSFTWIFAINLIPVSVIIHRYFCLVMMSAHSTHMFWEEWVDIIPVWKMRRWSTEKEKEFFKIPHKAYGEFGME